MCGIFFAFISFLYFEVCSMSITTEPESRWLKLKLGYHGNSPSSGPQGAVSIRKTVLPGMAIPMLKIRRPNGRLIFNMEIAIRR